VEALLEPPISSVKILFFFLLCLIRINVEVSNIKILFEDIFYNLLFLTDLYIFTKTFNLFTFIV
jgi:hypothetical protein